MKNLLLAIALLSVAVGLRPVIAETFGLMMNISQVPAKKQTETAYYISSKSAHDLIIGDPNIVFIDVREMNEVLKSGHPQGVDAIIPVRVQSEQWDAALGEFELVDNPNFVSGVEALLEASGRGKHDMVLITCGSGVRSAVAARLLEQQGYTNVWHIPDGYEGDDKPGLNTQNAWKNQGLPWSSTIEVAILGV